MTIYAVGHYSRRAAAVSATRDSAVFIIVAFFYATLCGAAVLTLGIHNPMNLPSWWEAALYAACVCGTGGLTLWEISTAVYFTVRSYRLYRGKGE